MPTDDKSSDLKIDTVLDPAPELLALVEKNNAIFLQVKIKLKNKKEINILALIDSGASGNFIDRQFCHQNQIPLMKNTQSQPVQLIDGTPHSSGPITHSTIPLHCRFGNTTYKVQLLVSDFPSCPMILGYPWLRDHEPKIDWVNKTMILPWKSCAVESNPLPPASLDMSSIPKAYQDLAYVFSKEGADLLPDERPFDCTIDLKDPSVPLPFKPIYNLSPREQQAQREYIAEQLQKGFIRHSKSPAGSPLFFVKKKDGSLRPCVDYQDLNDLTIKDRTPLPLINDLLDKIAGSKIFTKIDLRGAYNLVRIKKGDEWKTAFRTKYGLYEYLVMPFGLTNAPAVFQRMMNSIFSDMLDVFLVVYLDDMLIFSPDEQSHIRHVRAVLQRLKHNKLFAKLEKCEFHKPSVTFLGYVVSGEGVAADPEKVEAINKWPTPKKLKDVQAFLGFANFYRRFIPGFAEKARPITELTKKTKRFEWTNSAHSAMKEIIKSLTTAPVLKAADPNAPFILETDASDFAVGAVLLQIDKATKIKHPIAYYSRKLQSAEQNYTVHDKELLAIISAFQNWRHYLVGSPHVIDVCCDHRNLTFFRKKRILKPRHARWNLILSEFNFRVNFIPGRSNKVADALSRKPSYQGKESDDQTTLLPNHVWHRVGAVIRSEPLGIDIDLDKDWPLAIAHFLIEDSWPPNMPQNKLSLCRREARKFRIIGVERCLVRETADGSVNYLPANDRKNAIRKYHDFLGHLAAESILPLLKRRYWFPAMDDEVRRYCQECPRCQENRADSTAANPGPLRPIPPVALPFERWGLDFVGPLPTSKSGNRYILTAIDYGTRWIVAKPFPDKSSVSVMNFIYNHIVMEFGPPYEIITDRDKAFLEQALPHYEQLLRIKHLPTTSYHPRTNGMVERMHQMLNHSIRCLAQDTMDRWDEFLPQTVFAIRARTHSVTGHSPFYLTFGVHPRIPVDTTPPRSVMQPLDEIEQMELRGEFNAREFEELGLARRAATERSMAQAEAMRLRDENQRQLETADHRFDVGDWVKLKIKNRTKWERHWIGPLMIVQQARPNTYWLMNFRGEWLPNIVNEERLALWKGTDPGTVNPSDDDELMDYLINEPPDYVTAEPSYHVDPAEDSEYFDNSIIEEGNDLLAGALSLSPRNLWKDMEGHGSPWNPMEALERVASVARGVKCGL